MPDTVPNIQLNEANICNLCASGKNSKVDYSDTIPKYELLIENAKIKNLHYDCIVAYSGGKDSTYVLRKIIKKGLKPLAFTLDNGFVSQTAKGNIQKVTSCLGIDHIYFTPDRKRLNRIFKVVMDKKLFPKSSMVRVSSVCYICITYVNWLALQFAIEKNCEIIVSGFTHGQVPNAIFLNKPSFLKNTFEQMKDILSKEVDFDVSKFYPSVDFEKLRNLKIFNVNPMLFEKYDEDKIIKDISEYGWERPKDTDSCSSNCLINRVGNHFHEKLYGFHPYQYEISYLIRNGAISIEEGSKRLNDFVSRSELENLIRQLG